MRAAILSSALTLALGDLGRRPMLAILVRAIVWTLVIFAGLFVLLAWLLNGADPCSLIGDECPLDPWSGGFGAFFATLLLGWFLFPGVAIGVLTGMSERITQAVEDIHYPQAAGHSAPLGWGRGIWLGIRSGGRVLLYNLVALPIALILLITGIGPFIIFALVNGLAIAPDLGELAAGRTLRGPDLRDWLRANRWPLRLIGLTVGVLLIVPFVNLAAPLLGAAAAVHLYQRGSGARRAA
ncbi:hypothetical protein HMF7854_13240 [Sphingomonas ginkgonis]|uniref:Uncharacterized protein n=1 Tax=Sphingomonas ginkgonis TaxID=2315330 RepID=A0A3R9YNA8_9SPHN|nr:EI24 domain-containing protein [Sphingomonas ginkgonis]RST31693.1 hypothetical protein HMF7854_13240 [Sphingomonas ginkgonis]